MQTTQTILHDTSTMPETFTISCAEVLNQMDGWTVDHIERFIAPNIAVRVDEYFAIHNITIEDRQFVVEYVLIPYDVRQLYGELPGDVTCYNPDEFTDEQ